MSLENQDSPLDSTPDGTPNQFPLLTSDEVFVVDAFPLFQPIRLPAHAFYTLHRETANHLDTFVTEHCRKFPQIVGGITRGGRR